ncbi:UDP-2,3-diacylglucosamine diphosphatase [Rhodovibrionaceae bacterium A322]
MTMRADEQRQQAAPAVARRYKSIFLSDIHLGTKHCQAELLSDFLGRHEAEQIFLIGDIIDGWRLERKWYWPASHDAVLQTFHRKAEAGVRVCYIPGNHDEFARDFTGPVARKFNDLAERFHLANEVVHETADGRRYLIIHGDQFDVVVQNAKWMAYIGDWFYELCLTSNTWLNLLRRRLGLDYWSLGAFAKQHVKSFINIIGQYENEVVSAVESHNVDGVICGHIHHAMSRNMKGIHYVNTGDWVESCSAVVEHFDGRLEVLFWTARREKQPQPGGASIDPAYDNPAP